MEEEREVGPILHFPGTETYYKAPEIDPNKKLENVSDILARMRLTVTHSDPSQRMYRMVEPTCSVCQDARFVKVPLRGRDRDHDPDKDHQGAPGSMYRLERCACDQKDSRSKRQEALDKLSTLSAPLDTLPLARFDAQEGQEHAYAQTEQYLLGEQGFLFLMGPVGRGKTLLATYAAKALREKGFEVLWITASKLFEYARAAATTDQGSTERLALSRVIGATALVLDDLGAERVTDFAADVLHTLVDSRYHQRALTIFTTNQRWSGLNEREQSRLLDTKCTLSAYVGGADRRANLPTTDDGQRLEAYRLVGTQGALCSKCGCRPHSPVCTVRIGG